MSSSGLESLSLLTFPHDGDGWADWVTDRGRGSLRRAAAQVADLRATRPCSVEILDRWNDASISLGNAAAVASLLSSVHPDPAVVALAEEVEVETNRFTDDLLSDSDVFSLLSSVPADALDTAARRVLADALRAFRRAGVDREDDVRSRLQVMNKRQTELSQAFNRTLREGRRVARVAAEALVGMPADYRAEHPVEAGTVAISTDYPDVHPFLTHSHDAAARREVALEYFNLGWPENDAVLAELLSLRHDKALLLGYPDWPTFDAETKMIGTGSAIARFIDQVAADATTAAHRDLAILSERAAADGVATIDLANWRYYLETVKRERYGVDAQVVRTYFDFGRVRQGLLDVTGRLFGLDYRPVQVSSWHPEVSSYDVILDGELLGRIHLDLHPRPGKYNHAAQFDLVRGVAGRQLPEGVLVCNFGRGLMDHSEVVTLFHEFGHLLHHVLAGRHRWIRFSGVATEWDFVEAPSQLLEEWAWDAEVLQAFATDAGGSPIPSSLVEAMRAAEEFGKGLLARTQMFYAAVSYRFHLEVPADLTERLFELYREYSLVQPLPGTHFHAGFGHLDGYGSGYYTYFWSLVIAKDLFSAFDPEDLFDSGRALSYRDTVLAAGGSRDASDLVEEFLGRSSSTEAFAAWLDQ